MNTCASSVLPQIYVISLMSLTYYIGNDMSSTNIPHIIQAIKQLTELRSLSIDDSEFSVKQATLLAKAFESIVSISKLEKLSLCTCELTAKGAYHIAK